MTKSKILIFLLVIFSSVLILTTIIIYNFLTPVYSEQDCEVIRQNYEKLKLGMNKEEVLLLIKKEPDYKVYRYSDFFPEQETEWEIWLLCKDFNSCIIDSLGQEQCYEWQMIAFDTETGKVVKIFSDDPERVGFV